MNINSIFSRSHVQVSRPNIANAIPKSKFSEALIQKAKNADTFYKTSGSCSVISKEQLSSVNDTQRKLDKIAEDIKNTDYSGMTKAEIYADIEGRYVEAFDDFYASMAFATCKDHIMVNEHFNNSIDNYVGEFSRDILNEARGYSDMSYEEIEASIKEKYAGKNGFIDQLNLFGELYSTGVLKNKYGGSKAIDLAMTLSFSLECGGDMNISKSEWISRLNEQGVSSPFSLWVNNPIFTKAERDLFQSAADDILFGITDRD